MLQEIEQLAKQCVKCGLCLPHCPTYAVFQEEGESPRGRIALMEGMASGQLSISNKLIQHLDHCLLCGACEAMCPADVKYSEMLEKTRAEINSPVGPPQWLHRFIQHPKWHYPLRCLLWVSQQLGRGYLFQRFKRLKPLARMRALLPQLSLSVLKLRSVQRRRGQVSLFTGCLGNLLELTTLQATIDVLSVQGFETIVPAGQTCCSALYQHYGDLETAKQCQQINETIFEQQQPVLSCSSGCSVVLQAQTKLNDQLVDPCTFLLENWDNSVQIAPLSKQVLIHRPCSQAHSFLQATEILLRKIPDITVNSLGKNLGCCGAAGLTMMQQVALSQALAAPLIAEIIAKKSDFLVTSNVGCALHLQAELKRAGHNISVIHPLTLLARQVFYKKVPFFKFFFKKIKKR